MIDQTIAELAPVVGTPGACATPGRARATHYRRHRQSPPPSRPPRVPRPRPRALSQTERAEVLGLLHDERFVDQAPATVYARLLDQGRYVCSVPTMYGCCVPQARYTSVGGRPGIRRPSGPSWRPPVEQCPR